MADIIVVEDNKELGELLSDFLQAEGYDVYLAGSGEEGLKLYEEKGAKLLILDVMLPGMDGFGVCSRIRQHDNTPIIIVSAKGGKEDKLNGLFLGADDYIEKPYDIDILLARIRGIFKRKYGQEEIVAGELRLNTVKQTLSVRDREIELAEKEFELLKLLMENRHVTLKKEYLFNTVWGSDSDSEIQTLTVHIRRLREKLEADPKNPAHIITEWGAGYRFE